MSKVKCKRQPLLPALTAAFFPWPQAQVDRKHGRRHLKDWQGLLRVPLFPFLNSAQAKAHPAQTEPYTFGPDFGTSTSKTVRGGQYWRTAV